MVNVLVAAAGLSSSGLKAASAWQWRSLSFGQWLQWQCCSLPVQSTEPALMAPPEPGKLTLPRARRTALSPGSNPCGGLG